MWCNSSSFSWSSIGADVCATNRSIASILFCLFLPFVTCVRFDSHKHHRQRLQMFCPLFFSSSWYSVHVFAPSSCRGPSLRLPLIPFDPPLYSKERISTLPLIPVSHSSTLYVTSYERLSYLFFGLQTCPLSVCLSFVSDVKHDDLFCNNTQNDVTYLGAYTGCEQCVVSPPLRHEKDKKN